MSGSGRMSCPQCSICQEREYAEGNDEEAPVCPPCGHIFHRGCIERWLQQRNYNSTCPMCKVATTKKKLVALIWDQGEQDVSFTQAQDIDDDAPLEEKLRASEAEKRKQRRMAEVANATVTDLRKANQEWGEKVGELEAKLENGAASKELEKMNDTLVREIAEMQTIAEEALAKVSGLEEQMRKLEQESRAKDRNIGQVRFQNEQYCRQYEQMKEEEVKCQEKLKTYKYVDHVLAGGEEQAPEHHSKEQLVKLLAWRTKSYKELAVQKEKGQERRESAMKFELKEAKDANMTLQKANAQLQARLERVQQESAHRAAFKPLSGTQSSQQGDASQQSARGTEEGEGETDGYDTEELLDGAESEEEGGAAPGPSSGALSPRAGRWGKQDPVGGASPSPQRHSSAQQAFLQGASLCHGAGAMGGGGGIIITKSSSSAGQAPSLKRVSAVAAAQRAKSVVGDGLNRGAFIQQQRDSSGGIVTVLRPEPAPAGLKQRGSANLGGSLRRSDGTSVRKAGVKRPSSAMPAAKSKAARIDTFFGKPK